jgi:hypothetical protein
MTDTDEIQRIIREYSRKLYSNKWEDPEEIDPLKSNLEDVNKLNQSIMSNAG